MDGSARWGSSEYSAEAEQLFARFIGAGSDTDFEAFLALHPDHEDELIGLRTDWDNVRGVIGQLRIGAPCEADVPEVPPAGAGTPAPPLRPTEPAIKGIPWLLPAGLLASALAMGGLWIASRKTNDALAAERLALVAHSRELDVQRVSALEDKARLEREREALVADKRKLEAARAEAEGRARIAAESAAQLADARALERLVAEAAALWPAMPERAPAYEQWLARSRAIVERADARSAPVEAALQLDPAVGLETALEPALAAALEGFVAPADGLLARLGRRLELARDASGGLAEHADAWRAARAALGDASRLPVYAGLDLPPQRGLAPLGPSADTGLWEFAFLPTWEGVLEGGPNGSRTCNIILVLIPAAPQASDEGAAADPALGPFFLSRGPLTPEAWRRLAGGAEQPPAPEALAALGLARPDPAQWQRARETLWAPSPRLPADEPGGSPASWLARPLDP